jgi:hypothetical protein
MAILTLLTLTFASAIGIADVEPLKMRRKAVRRRTNSCGRNSTLHDSFHAKPGDRNGREGMSAL